ncbi:MAG: PIN domain-containing protein [Spirochaetes bacterium]|nr:PIN domain-containing protein [Spirochaetota bacterium]
MPEAEFLKTAFAEGVICIPTIVRYELLCGVKSKKHREQRIAFVNECHTLELTDEIADTAAQLFSDLRNKGVTIDNEDILIAATALSYRLPVATLNRRHFKAIENLEIYSHIKGGSKSHP